MSNPESIRRRIAEEEAKPARMFERSDLASGQGGSNSLEWRVIPDETGHYWEETLSL